MTLTLRRAALPSTLLPLAVLVVVLGCDGCDSHPHPHEDESHDHPHGPHGDHGEHEAHDDHGGNDDHGGHDDHGGETIGITQFTDKLELFAEHPAAVVADHELRFLAHLTILDGFKALEAATVTLVLDGPIHVQAEVTEMLRPGIFRPTIQRAPPAGTYRGSLVVTGPEVEDTIDGFEIVVHANAHDAEHASEPESGGPEPISFLKEQQWQVPFATAFAVDGSVVPSIEVAGEVTTPASGQADVGATIAGRVVAPVGGLPRPGQVVRRGEVLATIAAAPAAPEAAARAGLAVVEANARLQSANAAVERAERLIADRAIPQREVEDVQREQRVAGEAVRAARRARSVFVRAASGRGRGTYRVTAPIDGIVVDVQATEGRSVASGDLLLRLVNLGELWIRARVPEQEAARLNGTQDAAFKLPGVDEWFVLDLTSETPAASLVDIGRVVNRRSRTVDVIYALRQADPRLRVGAMLRVAVPAGEAWNGVVVPRDAVLDDDGRSVVYVQVEGESFEERTVQLGPRSGPTVGIVRGVVANERIVTRGANVIRLSSRSSSTPAHGHVH